MKNLVLQHALRLFLLHGIRKMSMQLLADALGISTKTLYIHYKNKEVILEEVLHLYHGEQLKEVEMLMNRDQAVVAFCKVWIKAFSTEHKINRAFFEDLHYYYPELAEKIESGVKKKFVDQMLTITQRAVDDGTFQKNIIPEIILKALLTTFSKISRERHYTTTSYSGNQILQNTLGVYILGLCTTNGLSALKLQLDKNETEIIFNTYENEHHK